MGPANWREYTGDPTIFYTREVGPVIDIGVYILTLLTGLLGHAQHVQAMTSTAIPERTVMAGPYAGRRIIVEGYDHALIQLELVSGALVQVLASFAVPATQQPEFELIGTTGVYTSRALLTPRAPFDRFSPGAVDPTQGWEKNVAIEGFEMPEVRTFLPLGPIHVARAIRGREPLLMTAEHARHVLEIMHKIPEAAARGEKLPLETRFPFEE